ncbi:MAG: TolC family protein, partial [Balneolaceae bacterium]
MKQYILFPVIILILALPGASLAQSQDSLFTLDQAIELGLENNHGIRISRNLAEISSNNLTLGNAGFLPEISASASRSESVVNSRFETAASSGENRGAESTSTNAGVSLNWTLFDGFQMFIAHEQLGELEELGSMELRLQMEETVSLIITSYLSITRISGQLRVFEDAVAVSRERIEIAETKRDLGSGSEYELLQARNDLNADRAAVLRERNRLEDAKILLNEILGRSP